MRRVTAVALLLALSTAAVTSVQLDPRDGVLLPANIRKNLLRQCSRDVPHDVSGEWTPTRKEIRDLESRLPSAMQSIAFQRGREYTQPADFRRQYAGLLVRGRKIVYVNAFAREFGDPNPNGPPGARHFDWRRQVVVVCDGGPAFFGVEYDPMKKTFSHFEFNGFP